MWFVLIKRKAVWGLEKFLFSIGPYCVNGVGTLRLKESPFGSLLSRKYGEEGGGWISREVREGYGVGFWKEIRKEGFLMFKNVSFAVGDGRRVKF